MRAPVKMLVIYVDETDLFGTVSLYEAIVRRLRSRGVPVLAVARSAGAPERLLGRPWL